MRDLDDVVVNRFYYPRDLLWVVNLSEDGEFIKPSSNPAQLVFENRQRFAINVDLGIGV